MVLAMRKELVLQKDGDVVRRVSDVRVLRDGGSFISYDKEVV